MTSESHPLAESLSPPVQSETGATKPDLKGMLPDELRSFISALGKEKFRSNQLLRWIHGKGVTDFSEMTDLAKGFREDLADIARVESLVEIRRTTSADGKTTKLVLGTADGLRIETVAMFDGDRRTVCVSSQVGCALRCRFCATGRMGLIRNLTPGEIVDQLCHAARLFRGSGLPPEEETHPVTNIVFMGMGEPLLNYDAVVRGVKLVGLEMGLAVSAARVTISTSGVVPMIYRLAEDLPKAGLAVSLNATTDETRSALMAINRKYPLKELMKAAHHMAQASSRRWVTFEYALIDGVNDADDDAHRLVELVSGFPCKINLIPFNAIPDLPYRRSSRERIERFHSILWDKHLTVTVRWSKGDDIAAACGQLQGLVPAEGQASLPASFHK